MRRLLLLPPVTLLLFGAACSGSDSNDAGVDSGTLPTDSGVTPADAGASDTGIHPDAAAADAGGLDPKGPLTFMTFNVGLIRGSVALAEQRQPQIIQALTTTTADVLCLNEVWENTDYAAIEAGLSATYPYHVREMTTDTSSASIKCPDLLAVVNLNACVQGMCAAQGISTSQCVASVCANQYAGLSDDCKICLAANTSAPASCAMGAGAKNFIFNGQNGVALFSKYPITASRYVPLEANLIAARGVLTATIADKVVVQCTHLSADLSPVVPYPTGKPSASFAEETRKQINVLGSLASRSKCSILMGDLNTGPGNAGAMIDAEHADNFTAVTNLGFREDWTMPRCTFCNENPLAAPTPSSWIDHIMLKNCPNVTSTQWERTFTAPITVTSGGNQVRTRLSDHYGLKATITTN